MATPNLAIASLRRCIAVDRLTVRAWMRKHWHRLAWLCVLALAAWVLPLRAAELGLQYAPQALVCGAVRG